MKTWLKMQMSCSGEIVWVNCVYNRHIVRGFKISIDLYKQIIKAEGVKFEHTVGSFYLENERALYAAKFLVRNGITIDSVYLMNQIDPDKLGGRFIYFPETKEALWEFNGDTLVIRKDVRWILDLACELWAHSYVRDDDDFCCYFGLKDSKKFNKLIKNSIS